MDLAIIGLGAFGSWLVQQYLDLGLKIKAYDLDLEKATKFEPLGVTICRDLGEAVKDVDVVIISVALGSAHRIIMDASKDMERGIIVDVSSLKKPVYSTLKNLPKSLKPVCIHPLFGPSSKGFVGKVVALIPVRDVVEELDIAEKMMPGARFVSVTAEEHDEAMAYILSLTHILSLAIVDLLKDVEEKKYGELSGTSFKQMCKMVDLVLSESRETLTSIIYYNEDTEKIFKRLLDNLYKIYELIIVKDYEGLKKYIEETKENYSKLEFLKKILL
ncbi:MAG: prephenate dehydrogenase [Candidatus Caldarchaeales archaeon]